jgi:hypothetical protein
MLHKIEEYVTEMWYKPELDSNSNGGFPVPDMTLGDLNRLLSLNATRIYARKCKISHRSFVRKPLADNQYLR